MLPRVVVAVCAAALCLALSGAVATAQISSLGVFERAVAQSPVTRAKCIVIAGAKFCDGKKTQPGGTDHKGTDKKDTGTKQAPTKCIVIAGKTYCGGKKTQTGGTDHKDTDKKDTGTKQAPTKPEPEPGCPFGQQPNGLCICPPGQVNYNDGCGKPCGYGMMGKPPNCRCPTGATLQVTGPTTKGCICPDGQPPEEVDGRYACQGDMPPQ